MVDPLASRFEQVVLTDVVVSPVARHIARKLNETVVCAPRDTTGALARHRQKRLTDRAGPVGRAFLPINPPFPTWRRA
jgi:hypothetical protein